MMCWFGRYPLSINKDNFQSKQEYISILARNTILLTHVVAKDLCQRYKTKWNIGADLALAKLN